jgi:hypothetical protein
VLAAFAVSPLEDCMLLIHALKLKAHTLQALYPPEHGLEALLVKAGLIEERGKVMSFLLICSILRLELELVQLVVWVAQDTSRPRYTLAELPQGDGVSWSRIDAEMLKCATEERMC